MLCNRFYLPIIFLIVTTPLLYADKFSETMQSLVRLDTQRIPHFIDAQIQRFGFDPANFPFQFDFSGYIKNESFLDSRQTYNFADGQFMLVPLQYQPDIYGCDINNRGSYNMSAVETRMRNNILGPKVYGLHTRAYIECDFFGNVNSTVNTLEMRHAFFELKGKNYKLLAGQTYHPLVYPVEAPNTVCFSSGSPMTPFLFNPQFRFGYESDNLDLYLSFVGNVALTGDGPDGASTIYVRNSMTPEISFMGRIHDEDQDNFAGIVINIKRLVPRLVTNLNVKSVEHINNLGFAAYYKARAGKVTMYGKTMYMENGSDFVMLGGYAVSTVNPQNDKRTYTNIRFVAAWAEFIYDLGKLEPAIFVGYGKNVGSTNPVIQSITTDGTTETTIYGFGNNISYVARVSPRLRCYYFTPFLIGTELEFTRASYGTIGTFGNVCNATPVNNFRWELAGYYIF